MVPIEPRHRIAHEDEDSDSFIDYDDSGSSSGFIVEDFNCEVCGCYEGDEDAVFQCISCHQNICHVRSGGRQ